MVHNTAKLGGAASHIMQQRSSSAAGFRLCVFPDRYRNILDENNNRATPLP